jgi:hypothetical protein
MVDIRYRATIRVMRGGLSGWALCRLYWDGDRLMGEVVRVDRVPGLNVPPQLALDPQMLRDKQMGHDGEPVYLSLRPLVLN